MAAQLFIETLQLVQGKYDITSSPIIGAITVLFVRGHLTRFFHRHGVPSFNSKDFLCCQSFFAHVCEMLREIVLDVFKLIAEDHRLSMESLEF